MKNDHSSTQKPKTTNLLKQVLQFLLVGVGLGVISGSIIKSITVEGNSGKLIFNDNVMKDSLKLPSFLDHRSFRFNSKNYNKGFNSLKEIEEIKSLSQEWEKIASKQNDLEASGFLFLANSQKYAELNPSKIMPAASSIKVPILVATLKLIDSGKLEWNEPLELTKDVIGGGAGWMAYQPIGTSFPVYEVANEMIRISDNTATNILIKEIGGKEALNELFVKLKLNQTVINNLLPDLNGTNTTSAKDLARIFTLVENSKALTLRTRDTFKGVMSTSRTNRLLPGGLLKGLGIESKNTDYKLMVKGYRVYNKTGDIGITYADAGLIEMPDNSTAVAAFIVKGPFNDPRSAELIRSMAAAMAPFLEEESSYKKNN